MKQADRNRLIVSRMKHALPRRRFLSLEEIAEAWGVSIVRARHILRDVLGVKAVREDV